MPAERELISDEDIMREWEGAWDEVQVGSPAPNFARRIEALVRRRLAERLRAAAKNEEELSIQWEKQIQAGDKDAMMGFNMCQLRKAGIEDAARIVEGGE